MSAQICTSIVETPLDPVAIEQAARRTDCGAFVSFIGVVRNHDDGEGVQGIDYSAHPQAEEILKDLVEDFARREGVHHIEAHHRVGSLHIGDEAMVIVVAAEHRSQAFTTCSDLVDEVKVRLPIWKKQFRLDGSHEWSGLR